MESITWIRQKFYTSPTLITSLHRECHNIDIDMVIVEWLIDHLTALAQVQLVASAQERWLYEAIFCLSS